MADTGDNLIRKITPGGVVTTFAGSDAAGAVEGTGTSASFNGPWGVAIDGSNKLFVTDLNTSRIRKITPAGVVTTLAGSGGFGAANGAGASATFRLPAGLAVDTSGNVFAADSDNYLIRKITSAAVVSTAAGTGSASTVSDNATTAGFNVPQSVAVDGSGNLFVTEKESGLIRRLESAANAPTPAATTATTAVASATTAASVATTVTSAATTSPISVPTSAVAATPVSGTAKTTR